LESRCGCKRFASIALPRPPAKVLPFLWRDRIVGRADLKSERGEGSLVVKAFHLEPGVRHSRALEEAFDRALDRLRRVAGLERVVR
jgi:hypothetical protein